MKTHLPGRKPVQNAVLETAIPVFSSPRACVFRRCFGEPFCPFPAKGTLGGATGDARLLPLARKLLDEAHLLVRETRRARPAGMRGAPLCCGPPRGPNCGKEDRRADNMLRGLHNTTKRFGTTRSRGPACSAESPPTPPPSPHALAPPRSPTRKNMTMRNTPQLMRNLPQPAHTATRAAWRILDFNNRLVDRRSECEPLEFSAGVVWTQSRARVPAGFQWRGGRGGGRRKRAHHRP